jgi:hypothetical protein
MPVDITVTRFPNGVTNNSVGNLLDSLKTTDLTQYHTYFDDFDYFVAASWTITETGAGGTTALTDGDGGLLVLTTDTADNDNQFAQKIGESFKFESGKRLFFKARLKLSDATQSDAYVGLLITDTTPLDVTDGVYFLKADDAATVSFFAEKNNTSTSASAITTLANDTFVTLGFAWDGVSQIAYSVDGAVQGSITPSTNLPDDEDLTVSFGIQAGAAAAKILTVDYVYVAKER